MNKYFDFILYKENLTVCAVDHSLYRIANERFSVYGIGLNDAMASIEQEGVNEICSFDTHFDKVA